MADFYVKDLSKLTGVSPQTLHHYDRIGLLKPSVRMANGYRLYGEKDLLRLKKIVSLKFFGFELSQIKILLESNANMTDHFLARAQFLEEKAGTLLEASKNIKNIISECHRDHLIPWDSIFKLVGL